LIDGFRHFKSHDVLVEGPLAALKRSMIKLDRPRTSGKPGQQWGKRMAGIPVNFGKNAIGESKDALNQSGHSSATAAASSLSAEDYSKQMAEQGYGRKFRDDPSLISNSGSGGVGGMGSSTSLGGLGLGDIGLSGYVERTSYSSNILATNAVYAHPGLIPPPRTSNAASAPSTTSFTSAMSSSTNASRGASNGGNSPSSSLSSVSGNGARGGEGKRSGGVSANRPIGGGGTTSTGMGGSGRSGLPLSGVSQVAAPLSQLGGGSITQSQIGGQSQSQLATPHRYTTPLHSC
jgi:hypothetical protein